MNLSGTFGNDKFILFQLTVGLKKQKIDFTFACLKNSRLRVASYNGILKQVLFAGHRDEFSSMYSSFDIYVQPYAAGNQDVLPLTVMQALACRLPIIVTKVGNLAEFVEEGVNGFVLPERKKVTLVEKLSFLISEDAARQEFGDNSYNLFKTRFILGKMVDETLEVFRKILDSQS